MGLDYRAVRIASEVFKVLGVIDFCIDEKERGKGIGAYMLGELSDYAHTRDVDFIILMSDLEVFYTRNGYQRVEGLSSWLRIHEHTNYGIAVENINGLYVKPLGDKSWPLGHLDWLGYQF